MNNPFEFIDARLSNIENILLDLKHVPSKAVNSEESQDTILDVSGAAKLLKLTIPTIYSKCSRSELPYMKRSNRIYFSEKDLLDYLKAGRVKTHLEIEADAKIFLQNSKNK